jgi:hypothetical protein
MTSPASLLGTPVAGWRRMMAQAAAWVIGRGRHRDRGDMRNRVGGEVIVVIFLYVASFYPKLATAGLVMN